MTLQVHNLHDAVPVEFPKHACMHAMCCGAQLAFLIRHEATFHPVDLQRPSVESAKCQQDRQHSKGASVMVRSNADWCAVDRCEGHAGLHRSDPLLTGVHQPIARRHLLP